MPSRKNIHQVLRAARLLNGETVELHWEQIPFHPHSEGTIPEAGQAFSAVFDQDLRVETTAREPLRPAPPGKTASRTLRI